MSIEAMRRQSMQAEDPIRVARTLIDRHGVRAAAVAEQQTNEAQLAAKIEALDFWRAVQSAIAELRRTAHNRAA
jgi:ABC-type sulfate transport system substrate-binding protein